MTTKQLKTKCLKLHHFHLVTEVCSLLSNIKFIFFKKATKIEEIFRFTVDLTSCSKCQIDGEDFVNFCILLRKHEL